MLDSLVIVYLSFVAQRAAFSDSREFYTGPAARQQLIRGYVVTSIRLWTD
jgi:hypothetical protein